MDDFITTWWGITVICVLAVIVWIIISAIFYRSFFKRFYDILLSGTALLVLSPLLLVLTVIGAVGMKGNPFFVQKRPGRINRKTGKERIFSLIKFRTMTCEKDENGNLLPDEKRLTKYGKFLRATSLDEIPELLNIFIGHMSIVGPRPLLVHYLPLYSEEQRHRHDVRPGLTGLAQVNGRNAISWEEKFNLDLEYVGSITLWKDVKIILQTALKVFAHSGISQEGHATMQEFTGNKSVNNAKSVVIIGAGGHAHVVADIVRSSGDNVVAFLDDNAEATDRAGGISDYVNYPDAEFVIGIGNADVRKRISSELKVKWYTAIHPSAVVSDSAVIGEGTVVMPNATVNARAKIGAHCIINSGAIVEHDNVIEDFVHVSVGAKLGGAVSVGEKTWVGIGATVNNNVSICGDCMIGAGALIISDINESGTYVGAPVRRL